MFGTSNFQTEDTNFGPVHELRKIDWSFWSKWAEKVADGVTNSRNRSETHCMQTSRRADSKQAEYIHFFGAREISEEIPTTAREAICKMNGLGDEHRSRRNRNPGHRSAIIS